VYIGTALVYQMRQEYIYIYDKLAIVVFCIYIYILYSVLFYTPAVFGVWKIELIFLARVRKKNNKKHDTRIACFPGTTAAAAAITIYNNKICTRGRLTVERFIVVAKKRRL